jgi:hypothetical protein
MDSLCTGLLTYTKKNGSSGVVMITHEDEFISDKIRTFLTNKGVSDINLNSDGTLKKGKAIFRYLPTRVVGVIELV